MIWSDDERFEMKIEEDFRKEKPRGLLVPEKRSRLTIQVYETVEKGF